MPLLYYKLGQNTFFLLNFCNPNKSFKWKLFSRKISLNHFSLQEANYRKMLWRILRKYKKEDKDMKPIFLYLLFMLLSSFGVWGLTEFMLVKHQRLRPNVTSMPESDRVKRSDWHFLPLSLHSTALKQCTTFQTFNFCPKITLGQNLPYKLILIIDPKFNENSFKAKLRIFQRLDQSRFSGEKWISKTMCWFFWSSLSPFWTTVWSFKKDQMQKIQLQKKWLIGWKEVRILVEERGGKKAVTINKIVNAGKAVKVLILKCQNTIGLYSSVEDRKNIKWWV